MPLVIRVPTVHIAFYPVPISIPTSARAKVGMEIGYGLGMRLRYIQHEHTHTVNQSVCYLFCRHCLLYKYIVFILVTMSYSADLHAYLF